MALIKKFRIKSYKDKDIILELKKISIMAETYYIPVSPHIVPGGPIEFLASAHVMKSIPNFYRLEHALTLVSEHNKYLEDPYEIINGELYLNDKPGLGFELNEAILTKMG